MALISAPVQALPDPNKMYMVETDACDVGVGAVLMQDNHPIAFISKAISMRHQGLSIYEKELLAVVQAVKKWHHYLCHKKFLIRTDHIILKFLLEQRITTVTQ